MDVSKRFIWWGDLNDLFSTFVCWNWQIWHKVYFQNFISKEKFGDKWVFSLIFQRWKSWNLSKPNGHRTCRWLQVSFNNYVDRIRPFFDHLPTYLYLDIFYHERGQKLRFLDHLPTSSCPRSYWMTPGRESSPAEDEVILATAGYDHCIKFWTAHTGKVQLDMIKFLTAHISR